MLVLGTAGWFVGVLALGVGLPLAIGVAILRYRLYDIDWIINRTLVYVPLTALLAGAYIALTGVFRAVVADSTGGNSDASIAFTTVVVVAMLTPAKNYLQERVDKHFKESHDPGKALDRLGKEAQTAAEMLDPGLFVQRFVETMTEALQAQGVRLRLADGGEFTQGDWDGQGPLTVPIRQKGRELGFVEIGPRKGGRPYTGAEVAALRRSLDSLAELLALRESTLV
jgi:hypothetical protein